LLELQEPHAHTHTHAHCTYSFPGYLVAIVIFWTLLRKEIAWEYLLQLFVEVRCLHFIFQAVSKHWRTLRAPT